MEVEFPDDQEDNAPDLGDTSEATGAALDCHFSNQGIQIGCSSGFQIVTVLERGPGHPLPLERVVHLLLDSAHLVHRRTGVANGVKLVKRDSGIGQMHC